MAKIIEAKFGLCVLAKLQFVNEEWGLPEKCPKQGLMGHPVLYIAIVCLCLVSIEVKLGQKDSKSQRQHVILCNV